MFWLSLINLGNIVFLAASVVLSIIKRPASSVAIIIAAALILKSRPGFDLDNLIFVAALILVLIIKGFLPFKPKVNAVIAVITSFIIFNLSLYLIR